MMMDVLGIPSRYEQWGEGEDILLLHGWGKSVTLEKHLWPLAQALPGYRVTAVEFPGHGQTGKPLEPWGVPQYAAWTQALMTQLHLHRPTVVAHSFGGRVALWLAAEEPQLFGRMVLTGAAGIRRAQTEEEKQAAEHYNKQKQRLEKLRGVPLAGALADKLGRRMRDKRSSPDYLEADEDMKQTFVRVISQDLAPLLKQVTVPTLLIWGENDDATPLWMGRQMERDIPDAALIVFEGRGHFAYLEELPRFAAIVRAFITEDAKQRA